MILKVNRVKKSDDFVSTGEEEIALVSTLFFFSEVLVETRSGVYGGRVTGVISYTAVFKCT